MRETNFWSEAIITIEARQRHCLLEHLLRLDEEARLLRFCHLADDAHIRRYVDEFDFVTGRVIGCFDGGQLRGAAELRPAGAPHSGVFEAAFSVERDWQGRGIGTALVLRAIPVARQIGAREILVGCLASNQRMLRIVEQFDSELVVDRGDWKAWLPLAETADDRRAKPPRALRRPVSQD